MQVGGDGGDDGAWLGQKGLYMDTLLVRVGLGWSAALWSLTRGLLAVQQWEGGRQSIGLQCINRRSRPVLIVVLLLVCPPPPGAGELHLEICLKDLQDDFMGGAEVRSRVLLYTE